MPTIEPAELVRAAGRLTELVFAHEYGRIPWLLIRLGATDQELAAALRAADANAAAVTSRGNIAYQTEVVSEAPIRLKREGIQAPEPDAAGLVRSLGDAHCYAVPIQKRTDVDAVFGERISIGRAFNKDIVLRHASISKFHSYFQHDGADGWTLSDAGAKNGTSVNGSRIPPRGSVEVVSGDHLVFGSVSTIVLDARTLWRVLRAR
jgi:hypothetical protein